MTYRLKDLAGDSIKGRFYEPEIQKVIKRDDEQFDVEIILKTRRRAGKIEYYVKWLGYPSKFNSWTDALQPKRSKTTQNRDPILLPTDCGVHRHLGQFAQYRFHGLEHLRVDDAC